MRFGLLNRSCGLAIHLRSPGARSAAILDNGSHVLIAAFLNLLWGYAVGKKLLN
jgi:hypothetical protein